MRTCPDETCGAVPPCGPRAADALVGIVATHLAALIDRSIEGLHHHRGILLRHLDIALTRQEVDMAHLLATMDVLVDNCITSPG